ncbi:hypothetical protein [Nocardia inohanensis]|uniref:hypothetical protein n=1 Tax=Nocardia inohanensis TaxID=209246 RepID=UPI000830A34E|nr:hypothetical protein [Nocardia inohanensis]
MTAALPRRVLGAATAAYGAAVAVRPEILLRPSGLGAGDEPALRTLTRLVALRDLASGLAMAVASGPQARRGVVAVRLASDLADTLVFGRALAGRPERTKTLAVTGGWGLLCAAAAGYEAYADTRRPSTTTPGSGV